MIHQTIQIDSASLTTYILENYQCIDDSRQRPAVVICPGGAYELLSDTETESIAIKMMALGYHAFVLRYSIRPSIYPTALRELAQSIKMIRENHAEWHIDPDKIIVAGFSAGGHLAASLGVFWQEDFLIQDLKVDSKIWQPNALMLAYPVITSGTFAHKTSIQSLLGINYEKLKEKMSLEKQVTSATPPTFLWHTIEDTNVPVENSMLFGEALKKSHVPFEMHLFPKGVHGLSLATAETSTDEAKQVPTVAIWPELFSTWVNEIF